MAEVPATAAAEWKAHWPKVGSAMVGMSFYAMLTYHFGLFIQPLQKEFGWSRADISLGLTIYTLGAFFLGPFIGALIDRIGTRKIGLIGTALTALTLASLSQANGSLTQWYLLWLGIAVTALGVKSTVWSAAISSLFTKSRSLALSLVLSGSAIAQFFSPIAANSLIAKQGWRTAYLWFGLGWGGISLLLLAFCFYDARDTIKTAAATKQPPVASLGGLTVGQALRSHQILRIALANVLMSTVGAGVTVHLVPILTGTGMDRSAASWMAATAGISGIIGKLATGWALDRVQGNVIPFFSFALGAFGYALLLNTLHSNNALWIGVLILGFTGGASLQVTTYLCSRYAGLRNFGKIYATIGSMLMFGTAAGPWIAGSIFDATKSYDLLLYTAIPVILASSLLFLGLGKYPNFDVNTKTYTP